MAKNFFGFDRSNDGSLFGPREEAPSPRIRSVSTHRNFAAPEDPRLDKVEPGQIEPTPQPKVA